MTNKSKEYPINHLKDDIKLFAIKQKLKKNNILILSKIKHWYLISNKQFILK